MPLIQSADTLNEVLDKAGVSRIALTLISGRCGSTWLASEIQSLGDYGWGDESLGPTEIESWENKSGLEWASLAGFTQWLRDHARGGIVWVQVGVHALSLLCEKILPVHLFWTDRIAVNTLTRRDHLAQALSFVRAGVTGEWHRVDRPDAAPLNWPPEVNDTLLRNVESWIIAIHDREASIDAFRRKVLARYRSVPAYLYEDLLARPEVIVSKVCEQISGHRLGSVSLSNRIKRISSEKESELQLQIGRLIDRKAFECCSHCREIQWLPPRDDGQGSSNRSSSVVRNSAQEATVLSALE